MPFARTAAMLALQWPVKIIRRALMIAHRPLFARCGRNVVFSPFSSFSYETISLGDDIFIGAGATFSASESAIVVGDKVT